MLEVIDHIMSYVFFKNQTVGRLSCLVATIVLAQSILCGRQQTREGLPDTLAKVGGSIVTSDDLAERIELMPWLGKNKAANLDSMKIQALNSLVAEKLMAREAMDRHLEDVPSFQMMKHSFERLLARDELYRQEVLDRITLGPEEISRGLDRYARSIDTRLMITNSETNANLLRAKLRVQNGNDSLASHDINALLAGQDTIEVRLGKVDQAVEDCVYALSVGDLSSPMLVEPYGWVVFQILDWRTSPDFEKQSVPERRLAVEQMLKSRKRDVRALKYFSETLSPKTAQADPGALRMLSDTLRAIILKDSVGRRVSDHYRPLPSDVDELRTRLGKEVDAVLVQIHDGPMTIGEAIEGMRYEAFLFRSLRRIDFVVEVNQMLKKIVEDELLAREALRKHLQNSPGVRRDLAMWSDYWAANAIARLAIDSIRVTPDEIADNLIKRNNEFGRINEVNIQEIFLDNIHILLQLALRIHRGESMGKLAGQHSKRSAWAQQAGESGFFSISDHPAIGLAALMADTGILTGPLETEGGYSLFRVLGKRIKPGARHELDSLAAVTKTTCLNEKGTAVLERYVAGLATKFGVEFRYEALKNVKVRPLQLVTKRMIGFGGSIPAVPPLVPIPDWTKRQAKVKDIFQ